MSRPRVVLLRGHSANPWDLRPWELLEDRFDVSVLVSGANAFDVSPLLLRRARVRTLRDRLPRLAVLAAGDRYLGLERHLAGADLVHSAELGVWFSHQPALLKERLGFRLALTVWETIPFRSTYRAFRGRAQRAETIPRTDLFLATTERARASLLLEDVPEERIAVCPPGIDVERFAASAASPPREHLILSAGRLVWEKGHQDVLRALALLVRGGRDARLLIVGAGPERARLERYAADLGVRDRVELREHVPYDEMPVLYGQASCLVLASLPTPLWEEQFGMVLAEGLAAGVPIVAAASGAIPEVLAGNGTLVRPGDWEAIARALAEGPLARPPGERVRHDPELVGRYSTRAAAERLAAAYDRLLDRH